MRRSHIQTQPPIIPDMFSTIRGISEEITAMKESYHIFLNKSQESLNTAKFCFEKAYYNSCVNRAYYAMFQAAVAILFKAGIRPKSKTGHDWVQAEFSKAFVWGSKRFSHLKGFLNLVQEVRNIADYSDEYIDKKKAKRALDKAVIFFGEISKEIRK